jgi:hypothetical protein
MSMDEKDELAMMHNWASLEAERDELKRWADRMHNQLGDIRMALADPAEAIARGVPALPVAAWEGTRMADAYRMWCTDALPHSSPDFVEDDGAIGTDAIQAAIEEAEGLIEELFGMRRALKMMKARRDAEL